MTLNFLDYLITLLVYSHLKRTFYQHHEFCLHKSPFLAGHCRKKWYKPEFKSIPSIPDMVSQWFSYPRISDMGGGLIRGVFIQIIDIFAPPPIFFQNDIFPPSALKIYLYSRFFLIKSSYFFPNQPAKLKIYTPGAFMLDFILNERIQPVRLNMVNNCSDSTNYTRKPKIYLNETKLRDKTEF